MDSDCTGLGFLDVKSQKKYNGGSRNRQGNLPTSIASSSSSDSASNSSSTTSTNSNCSNSTITPTVFVFVSCGCFSRFVNLRWWLRALVLLF